MEKQTQVKNVRIRDKNGSLESPLFQMTQAEEITQKKGWLEALLQFDQLARNLAVVGVLFALVVAVRSAGTEQAQSVFGALKETAGMQWDDSVGKLSFVNALLPESIQAVWNAETNIEVFSPVNGEIVHAWSRKEPYVLMNSSLRNVRAAEDGEVMSIAHGPDEERIVRIRHENCETLYGNLASTTLQEGDLVYAGDIFGQLMDGRALSFELRVDGKSVDPQGHMMPILE